MEELLSRHCEPVTGQPALSADQCSPWLEALPGWRVVDGALERRFTFADFHHTMAFVNAVAWVAHREDHHPDLHVGWGACTVRFSTHSVKGLSVNDFICAARVDALQA